MSLTELLDHQRVGTPERPATVTQATVVVAVDGRPASEDVLAWAADEALCRGMPLRIVTVFADADQPYAPRTVDKALQLQHRLRRRIARGRPWIDEAEHIIARGSLRRVLAEMTRADDILVVGEAIEASATDLSQRPSCPVVIIPAAPTAAMR